MHKKSFIPLSIFLTLLLSRIFLHFFPATNISFFSYTIHHFYIGVALLFLLLPFLLIKKLTTPVLLLLGISLALILDEFFFLVFTTATDLDYRSSLLETVVITSVYLIYFYLITPKLSILNR